MKNGWTQMSAGDRYDEARKDAERLEKRRDELKRRGAPMEMLDRYSADIHRAKRSMELWWIVKQGEDEAKLRME